MSFLDRVTEALGTAAGEYAQEAAERLGTYRRLLKLIEMQVPSLAGHSTRVARYAKLIATSLELPPEQVQDIRVAAELHDIGETRIDGRLLTKPDKLTAMQVKKLREHPVLGAEMLEGDPSLKQLAPLIRYHHERWDGSGYPDELEGTDIPLGARIIAVADVFDVLTSERSYSRAYASADALRYLSANAGKLYDAEAVGVLADRWSNSRVLEEPVQKEAARPTSVSQQSAEDKAAPENSMLSRWKKLVLDLPGNNEDHWRS